jgi:hypothetical protein
MIQITQQARAELHFMLESVRPHHAHEAEDADAIGFRLLAATADESRDEELDLALTVDSVRDDDEVFDHNGAHVLLVGPASADAVGDGVLDVVDTDDGRRLGIRKEEP